MSSHSKSPGPARSVAAKPPRDPRVRKFAKGGPFDRKDRHYQAVTRRLEDDISYEFIYVYEPDGTVLFDECFWLLSGLSDDGLRIVTRWMSYGDYKAAAGGDAPSFLGYSAKTNTLQTIRKWFRDPRAKVLEAAGVQQTYRVER